MDLKNFSQRLWAAGVAWARVRPLMWLAAAAMVGVKSGDVLPPQWLPWLVTAGCALALWMIRRRTGWFVTACLLTAICFAGIQLLNLRNSRDHPLYQDLLHQPGGDAILLGRVESALRRDMPGATPGTAWFHATRITAPQLHRQYEGLTMVRLLTNRHITLRPGTYRIQGTLQLANVADNPGQVDLRDRDLRHGLAAECRVKTITLLQADRWNPTGALTDAAEKCRDWIKAQLSLDLEDAPSETKLIQATLLGASEAKANEIEKPFRETGTVHIFAVAGLHVGMIGLILAMFLRALGVPRQKMLLLLIPALFAYAFITGLRPSTFRAAVMASVFLFTSVALRRSDILNSLGAAALIILGWDTQEFFSLGFQLSFSVIAAIAVLEPVFRGAFRWWVEPDPFLPRVLLPGWQRHWVRFKQHVVGLFSVSAAATCGSLPLMLANFRLATPSAILANMVLVPIAFCILFTAVVTLGTALVGFRWFQLLLCNANLALAKGACACALMFSHLPAAYFYLPPVRLTPRPPVELTILRMPGGAAAQHLRAGSHHWLLDCGPAKDYPFLLHAYLQSQGVNQLTGLILSHSNTEHVGGALDLSKEYPIGAIYQSALEPWRGESSRSGLKLLYLQGVRAKPLAMGDVLAMGDPTGATAEGRILYPARETKPRLAADRALVMQLRVGNSRVLWCNDAGFIAEKAILETFRPDEIRSDVIIRDQHATDLSMTDEFLDAVRPRYIVSSNNSFPPEQKLPLRLREACRKRGIHLLDQAACGAVRLEIWPTRVEVHPMRGAAEGSKPRPQNAGEEEERD